MTPLLPPTRYQGSKRRFCAWIATRLTPLGFDRVLDAFGGTGAVSYVFKAAGKQTVYNDLLVSNAEMARALLENDSAQLGAASLERLVAPPDDPPAPSFIARTFRGIYFTDAENRQLDHICARVPRIRGRYRRALAWYAVFQACLAKRPYNLFHRRNLYMRTARVQRSFGNKRTWDTSFDELIRRFAGLANDAILPGPGSVEVRSGDVFELAGAYDLVYLDPPYVSRHGVGVDYAHFYHFLEGMLDYARWPNRIDWESKHRRLRIQPSPWLHASTNRNALDELLGHFPHAHLALSYRNDGQPSVGALTRLMRRHRRRVRTHLAPPGPYALSTRRTSREVLIIGSDA